jgi:hypothetical protein
MAFQKADHRGDLWGVAALLIIGVALIVLAPTKQSIERVSAAVVQARTQERHARLIQSLEWGRKRMEQLRALALMFLELSAWYLADSIAC